jgi:flagellar hook protein FlgE
MAGAGDMHVSMLGNVQKDLGISQINGSMMKQPEDAGDDAAPEYKSGTDILSTDTEMMVGFLESGNVDLAEEIAELITTQRGYQANTRIITVTDSMLEELVNMKR